MQGAHLVNKYSLILIIMLQTHLFSDTKRAEPSLFLEYEREVTRTIDIAQDEPNPFKKIIAPITPKAPIVRQVSRTEPVKSPLISDKPEIGNDALPFLVISKPVLPSTVAPIICPTTQIPAEITKNEENTKTSLFGNLHSVKERIMARAKQLLGTPYGFGSKEATQTDCSGFTQQVFSQFGVSLPHSAAEQAQYGKDVDSNDLQVGDLMFYHTYKDEPSHVAIYAGDGQIIHASYKNRRVQYDAINKGYYKQRFMYAKRLALNNHDASSE